MGMSYPADVELVAEFSKLCKNMIVIEERRSFLEKNIRDSIFSVLAHEEASSIAARLFGKAFPVTAEGKKLEGIPSTRGLYPSVLAQILIPLIKATEEIPPELRNGRLSAEMELLRRASKPKLTVIAQSDIVARTPTFCPGCPHRDSSAALLEVRQNFANEFSTDRRHKGCQSGN